MSLNDQQLALIHAALDGELSAEEQRSFGELIARSAAARRYYYACRQYQKLLQGQEPPPPAADLPDRLWTLLLEHNGSPPSPAEPAASLIIQRDPRPRRRSRPVPLLITAFSLFVASAAALLLGLSPDFRRWFPSQGGAQTAQQPDPVAPVPSTPPNLPHRPDPAREPHHRDETPEQPRPPVPPPPQPPPSALPTRELALAPPPRQAPLDLFTAPPIPPVRISFAEVRLPFLRSLSEFDREDIQLAFLRQLQSESAVRIDLFSRDLHRGVQWLQKTASQAGLHLFVDATTVDRLKKNQPLTAILLYCDGLTPPELTRLFLLLHAEDARISPRLFDGVHVMPLSQADERDLREVLGVDPGLGNRTRSDKGERNHGEVPQRPISDQTADEVVHSLLSKGKIDKAALLTAWGPPVARVSPFLSVEVKAYLARRATRPPQAVPAVIILRVPLN